MDSQKKQSANKWVKVTRRDFIKAGGAVLGSVVLLNTISSCNQEISKTTTPKPTTSSNKTLKIGFVVYFGSDTNLESMRGLELMVAQDNEKGGIEIGGERYNVQLIEYDTNNDQATEVAAINRLIFEDNVKFIIGGEQVDSWLPVAESNKVLAFTQANEMNLALRPQFNYSFNAIFNNPGFSALAGWVGKKYPEQIKSMVCAYPDNMFGKFISQTLATAWKTFGADPTTIFFPASVQDLSSLGTRVMNLNPYFFTTMSGSNAQDGQVIQSVRQAGYKGKIFSQTQKSIQSLKNTIDVASLEGFICEASATEFAPALNQSAKDFKDAWIAKYGEWTYPSVAITYSYPCLKTALQKAGTLDAGEVSKILSTGMTYETLEGTARMISRPDLGNDRTVDSASTYYVKEIRNGQAVLTDTINIDDAISYFRMAHPPLAPGVSAACQDRT